MSIGDLLARLIAKLDRAGIPHMITGSFASTFHGVPRTTHDIDLVVDPDHTSLAAFLADLPALEYYVDADTALDALARRTQFNVIDTSTGWKVDLIVRKHRSFSEEEFRRRVATELFGARVFVATAEDIIVAKLEWAKMAGSEQQLRDVAGVMAVKGAALDTDYIERWVQNLGLSEMWRKAHETA